MGDGADFELEAEREYPDLDPVGAYMSHVDDLVMGEEVDETDGEEPVEED